MASQFHVQYNSARPAVSLITSVGCTQRTIVYEKGHPTRQELQTVITQHTAQITPAALHRVFNNRQRRVQTRIRASGGNFRDHLWWSLHWGKYNFANFKTTIPTARLPCGHPAVVIADTFFNNIVLPRQCQKVSKWGDRAILMRTNLSKRARVSRASKPLLPTEGSLGTEGEKLDITIFSANKWCAVVRQLRAVLYFVSFL